MQTRITTARREAEGLKDRIKRKKDDLADTSRKFPATWSFLMIPKCRPPAICAQRPQQALTMVVTNCRVRSPTSCRQQHRSVTTNWHEAEKEFKRTLGQNICDALVHRQKTLGFGVPGWKTHHLGRIHDQQSPRNSLTIIMGDDLRLCTKR